ncbi:hypothetical protein IWQ60_002793 [Tieghemiomyces parasiticus]|uniref:C2H2-type domain-containing protein n=1 Tax=Tieghemiomyces parasiticus TaxID=78921 RepID=A0A9W8DX23_9FUNG|nr:hypothetical protein IWQ60_002793 [Tieghemiomyces parasiticus]
MEAHTLAKPEYPAGLPGQGLGPSPHDFQDHFSADSTPVPQGYPMYSHEQVAYERSASQFGHQLYPAPTQSPAPGINFSSSSPSLSNCSSPSYQNQPGSHAPASMDPSSSAHSNYSQQQSSSQHHAPANYYMEPQPNPAIYYSVGQPAPNAMAGPAPFLPALNLMPGGGAPIDANGYPMSSAPHFAQTMPNFYDNKPYPNMEEPAATMHHGYGQMGRFDDAAQMAFNRTYHRSDTMSPFTSDPNLTSYISRFPSAKRSRSSTTKNKRYICTVCQAAFARPSTLTTHMNKHTGAKPHMCPQAGCGKRFSVLSNMRRHRKIHERNQLQAAEAAQAQLQAHAAHHGVMSTQAPMAAPNGPVMQQPPPMQKVL